MRVLLGFFFKPHCVLLSSFHCCFCNSKAKQTQPRLECLKGTVKWYGSERRKVMWSLLKHTSRTEVKRILLCFFFKLYLSYYDYVVSSARGRKNCQVMWTPTRVLQKCLIIIAFLFCFDTTKRPIQQALQICPDVCVMLIAYFQAICVTKQSLVGFRAKT